MGCAAPIATILGPAGAEGEGACPFMYIGAIGRRADHTAVGVHCPHPSPGLMKRGRFDGFLKACLHDGSFTPVAAELPRLAFFSAASAPTGCPCRGAWSKTADGGVGGTVCLPGVTEPGGSLRGGFHQPTPSWADENDAF